MVTTLVKENHHYANKSTAMWGENNETYFSVKISMSGKQIIRCSIFLYWIAKTFFLDDWMEFRVNSYPYSNFLVRVMCYL